MSQFNVKIDKEGSGPTVKNLDTIRAHYIGMLTNGRRFDASVDRGEPLSFRVGAGQVIKCWDKGFVGLKVGTEATLTCPPDYAYGNRDVGGGLIPPNSTLIFKVQVVDIV